MTDEHKNEHKKGDIFPYEVDEGSVTDFVDGHFVLVVKDQFWSDEEIELFRQPIDLHFCYTNDLAFFIVEGGPLDSGDFYFNVQECDDKEALLNRDLLSAELLLIDGTNQIRAKRSHDFSKEESRQILELLKKQNETEFMPGEYEVNVEGLQNAYEPYDLEKFSKVSVKL
ncbi:hypothetical protein [Ileibacterium valens]|uniref:Uncharacterized protein n=1 Tax=Ileibacterium valens TaxID=1862668 RepID=A0A1U7NE72_9FIRM|nr:hypothetical protein [Ileibacterium valens]OLU36606.1 hypothetical protein BO224_12115 [Erysipelotrichaceae bacterium NYU-BL-E8]OLU37811.1 hypothetical protein BO222_09700 [Ileibacterium valens]OLU41858.1 hypothetical protein BM735_03440 [Erysipelotrichaceae bacterium NYU-BL-F16]